MTYPHHIAMLSLHTSPLAVLGGKETGGMNVYVRELSRELAARGLCIDIFTRSQNPRLPRVQYDLLGVKNARVINVPAGPEAPYSKHLLVDHLEEYVEGVSSFAQREGIRYDVLHAHYWLSGVAARELQNKWSSVPIVQMFHTLGAMKNMVAVGERDRETEKRIEAERELMQQVSRVIASTPRDKQQMIDLYGAPEDRIVVIPPGVDTDLFHPIVSRRAREWVGTFSEKTVLFVGRIDPVKGLDTWFRAMRLVLEAEPSLRTRMCVCLIGGDLDEDDDPDSEMVRLDKLKDELGISDIVTFLGGRAQSSLPYYYASADVVVMPSRYESFGLAALEAMACGTPVVASDVGGLSFIVRDGETGFLVPEGNINAFAECILSLLRDRDLRNRLGARAVVVAQNYAWHLIADKIVDLYKEVLEDTGLDF
jgi:D-inositol-3-phosphate glycosyltransferase